MKSVLAAVLCVSSVLAHGGSGHFHAPHRRHHGHGARIVRHSRPTGFDRVDGPDECPVGTEFDLDSCTCHVLERCRITCAGTRQNNPLKGCGCMSESEYDALYTHDH